VTSEYHLPHLHDYVDRTSSRGESKKLDFRGRYEPTLPREVLPMPSDCNRSQELCPTRSNSRTEFGHDGIQPSPAAGIRKSGSLSGKTVIESRQGYRHRIPGEAAIIFEAFQQAMEAQP